MPKETPPHGIRFYQKAGLTKAVVVHLSPGTYDALKKEAELNERSLQVTLRRILDQHARKQSGG